MTAPTVHIPVLLDEVLHWLRPAAGMTLVDGTLGGGGHTRALAELVGPAGRALGMDLDPVAVERAEATLATQGLAGIIFDQYSPSEFKFAGIDAETGDVVIGYHTAKSGWVYVAT